MFRRLRAHRRTIAGAGPQQPEATILGLEDSRFSDLYHFLLTESWPVLLAGIVIIFVAVNSVFAIVYMLDKGVENARPGSFADAFFFSVQTMATIGYGKMDPDTFLAEVMMSIEALTGLVGLAMVTGLVFAKFSRPTARVRFSRVAIVSNRDGIPSLAHREPLAVDGENGDHGGTAGFEGGRDLRCRHAVRRAGPRGPATTSSSRTPQPRQR